MTFTAVGEGAAVRVGKGQVLAQYLPFDGTFGFLGQRWVGAYLLVCFLMLRFQIMMPAMPISMMTPTARK